MTEAIIEIKDLTKIYTVPKRKGLFRSEKREIKALDNVSFNIQPGEIFGLLGPNGAGKTTLIKCLTTLLLPTGGKFSINGFENTSSNEYKIRASLGTMLMGDRGLYWKLTGKENLLYFGYLFHVPKRILIKRVNDLIELLKLGEFADRAVESYSSGQKMKFVFAKSLINDAPILLLDEPTNTLDLPSAIELRQIVKRLNVEEGKTVIYCTHLMHEAEELCNRVAIIDHGKILEIDSPDALKAQLDQDAVIEVDGQFTAKIELGIQQLEGVKQVTLKQVKNNGTTVNRLRVIVDNTRTREVLPGLIRYLMDHNSVIEFINPKTPTLEDVFIAKTGRSLSVDTRTGIIKNGTGNN